MARNKSEKGPNRPGEMSEEAMADVINGITVGQDFRIWYHDLSRYTFGPAGYEMNGACLLTKEEPHMLAGDPCDFTCKEVERHGFTAACGAQFYLDHTPLFHAIEIL